MLVGQLKNYVSTNLIFFLVRHVCYKHVDLYNNLHTLQN